MLVFLRKTPEFTKMGEIRELFVLALSFGLPGRLPIEHKLFRSNFSATLGNPTGPAKVPGYLSSKGHTELFGPHPFTWKTPTPPEDSRTQKFEFLLVCLV